MGSSTKVLSGFNRVPIRENGGNVELIVNGKNVGLVRAAQQRRRTYQQPADQVSSTEMK